MSGYLYILKSNGYYKIGISKNSPQSRVRQLQTGNPNKIKLVKYYRRKDYKELEQRLHKQFRRYHVSGEWYAVKLEKILLAVEGKPMRVAAYVWFFIQVLFVLFMVYMIVDVLWLNGTTLSLILDLMY